MLKKAVGFIILTYFSLGSLILPMGNFALLSQLPQMYQHCKTHEHPDMDAWEFITDHLVNVDGMFDAHDNGDDQKPHTPILNENTFQQVSFDIPYAKNNLVLFLEEKLCWGPVIESYESNYSIVIFRPPIV